MKRALTFLSWWFLVSGSGEIGPFMTAASCEKARAIVIVGDGRWFIPIATRCYHKDT
jgi:hypothetical protein